MVKRPDWFKDAEYTNIPSKKEVGFCDELKIDKPF